MDIMTLWLVGLVVVITIFGFYDRQESKRYMEMFEQLVENSSANLYTYEKAQLAEITQPSNGDIAIRRSSGDIYIYTDVERTWNKVSSDYSYQESIELATEFSIKKIIRLR